MLQRRGRLLLLAGAAVLVLLFLGRAAVDLYTDGLWFASLGQLSIFWTRVSASLLIRLIAALLVAAIIFGNLWVVSRHVGPVRLRRRYGNLEIAEQLPRGYILTLVAITALLAGWWIANLHFGGEASLATLAWWRRVEWGATDPLFGRDLSFYVFSLPLYVRILDLLLLTLVWSALLALLGYILVGAVRWRANRLEIEEGTRSHLVTLAAAVIVLLGVTYWLARYRLLLDGHGFGDALGYTDVKARLPGYALMSILALAAAGALVYAARARRWAPALVALGALALGGVVAAYAYPSFMQKFRVEPNQLAREAPYIEWNLDFTRRAYGLDRLARRRFSYRRLPAPSWAELAPNLSRLPLWDPEPLQTAYNQTQAIIGYYHFPLVDYDRYGPPGAQEQVAIAVREFNPSGLPEGARTWQTLRLNPTYVRGRGVVATPAAEISGQGQPVLWLSNLDPVLRHPGAPAELRLDEPSVYFGETMGDYVFVKSDDGAAAAAGADPIGVRLSSLARVFAFAWRFGDKNLLFSGEVDRNTKLLFRRSVAERLQAIAPFLLWDPNPYPVLHRGRVVWLVDGYTVSGSFPLARPLQLEGLGRVRYLSGSVKAVVDGVTGDVSLYALSEAEPILETYRRIFPNLIQPLAALPEPLQRHLRYPALLLRAQSDVLEEYHLQRAELFYAGQDVWTLPELGRENQRRPYRPAYTLLRLPGEPDVEFVLLVPFIALQRQNMTAFLVARNDPPHYGELLLYELPRDQQIPGPGQVEALLEQDPVIAPQLSLWRQAGSTVELGHLRVVPLDSTFLYVVPLFLSAVGRPIPELQRVIASDGQNVTMLPTLPEALAALRGPGELVATRPPEPRAAPAAAPRVTQWPRRALELLEDAERRLRNGDWAGFGARWAELRRLLQQLETEL